MRESTRTISFDAMNYDVVVVKTDDIFESRNKRADVLDGYVDKTFKTARGLHSNDDEIATSYIFLYPKSPVSTVAHECYHAVCCMFRYIGAEDMDEEVTAYHLGYLTEQVNKFINGKN